MRIIIFIIALMFCLAANAQIDLDRISTEGVEIGQIIAPMPDTSYGFVDTIFKAVPVRYYAPNILTVGGDTLYVMRGVPARGQVPTWDGTTFAPTNPTGTDIYFNATFTGSTLVVSGSSNYAGINLYRSGVLMREGKDYTRSGDAFNFVNSYQSEALWITR